LGASWGFLGACQAPLGAAKTVDIFVLFDHFGFGS